MFCAPVVDCEISEPPTTPRGTSRSAPGLTTFTRPPRPSWAQSIPWRQLDLQRRLGCRLVVDLERGVVQVEAFLQHPLQRAAELVTVLAGADHHVGGQGG